MMSLYHMDLKVKTLISAFDRTLTLLDDLKYLDVDRQLRKELGVVLNKFINLERLSFANLGVLVNIIGAEVVW